jgi:hypothetical protein
MYRIIIVALGNIPLGCWGTAAWFSRVRETELALPKVDSKPTYLKMPGWILGKPPLGYTYFLVTRLCPFMAHSEHYSPSFSSITLFLSSIKVAINFLSPQRNCAAQNIV